ncbi:MAG: nucleoside-diphosphate kinase [Alphaproteobacteria bacterium]|nr:nucleoside-diphosphate kinase [Alphaproteobacteria bacterium]MBN2780021.1 nucleoside-diphosphate kinase [Alphaproteobacteria bacterium]
MIENTFVIFKPDAVGRGLVGKILQRFEDVGLEISHMERIEYADETKLRQHYNKDDVWKNKIGGYVRDDYKAMGLNPTDFYGTEDALKLGQIVIDQLIDYLQAGPIITMILTGPNAVKAVRKIVGDTYPVKADPSSIRGMYSTDSKEVAALQQRSVMNLLHASGEAQEAKDEIAIWAPNFNPEKNCHGKRVGGCCGGGNCGSH